MKKHAFLFAILLAAFLCAWAQDPPQLQPNTTLLAPPRVLITVATPNGGEQVLRGAQQTIQWTKMGDIGRPTVQIKKDGVVVRSYPAVTPAGPVAGKWSWTWNVPASLALGRDYKVRVVSENGRAADESNANFHVVASKIEVYMPRAGERYRRGSTMSIHFRCFNVTQNLKIYQINFANFPIAVNVPPDRGIVEWRTVGTSPDGMTIFPSGYIVVAAMDGTVLGMSHPYELYD
ncbi:MAG: hypothetical protein MUC72_01965 [Acidobacteria bacterium]|nr:hypothetical protein [Acidobacteriota bacterium]